MEAMVGNSLYSYPYLNKQKCFVFLIIVYTLSSLKLEIRTEEFLPGSERVKEKEGPGERGKRWWVGGRNYPNIVCTYE
jgi:hypothetical protein